MFAAHMLCSGLPFQLRDDFGGHSLPAGKLDCSIIYKHIQFYVDKMKDDLKNIGAWDRSLRQVVVACRLK